MHSVAKRSSLVDNNKDIKFLGFLEWLTDTNKEKISYKKICLRVC